MRQTSEEFADQILKTYEPETPLEQVNLSDMVAEMEKKIADKITETEKNIVDRLKSNITADTADDADTDTSSADVNAADPEQDADAADAINE